MAVIAGEAPAVGTITVTVDEDPPRGVHNRYNGRIEMKAFRPGPLHRGYIASRRFDNGCGRYRPHPSRIIKQVEPGDDDDRYPPAQRV